MMLSVIKEYLLPLAIGLVLIGIIFLVGIRLLHKED